MLADPVRAIRMQAAVRLTEVPRDLLEPYQQEALDLALSEYRGAMTNVLDFANGGFNLGNLATRQEQQGEAERYYRTALAIDDLFYPAKVSLAVLLNQQGRNEEAETLLREAASEYPEVPRTAYLLGLLLAELGNSAEAAVYLEQAAEHTPQPARVLYNLGLLYQQMQQLDRAETALQRAAVSAPGDLEILYALVDHYVHRGRLDDALEITDQMIETRPEASLGRDLQRQIEAIRNATPPGEPNRN